MCLGYSVDGAVLIQSKKLAFSMKSYVSSFTSITYVVNNVVEINVYKDIQYLYLNTQV